MESGDTRKRIHGYSIDELEKHQYDILKDKSVSLEEIYDIEMRYGVCFKDVSMRQDMIERFESDGHRFKKPRELYFKTDSNNCYLSACERGEIDVFKYFDLGRWVKRFMRYQYPKLNEPVKTKVMSIRMNVFKQGFTTACATSLGHSEFVKYLKRLYQKCEIKFDCGACGKSVQQH